MWKQLLLCDLLPFFFSLLNMLIHPAIYVDKDALLKTEFMLLEVLFIPFKLDN